MKNVLLLDFGEVLISLDPDATPRAFNALSAHPDLAEELHLWQQFERGQLTPPAFLDLLGSFFPRWVKSYQLTAAWNALLGEVPQEKISWLKKWSKHHTLCLVSNTNALHLEAIQKSMGALAWKKFTSHFDYLFFSHELGSAKPEPEFYHHVLKTVGCAPTNCLLVDDKQENLIVAELLGIETLWYQKGNTTFEEINRQLTKNQPEQKPNAPAKRI